MQACTILDRSVAWLIECFALGGLCVERTCRSQDWGIRIGDGGQTISDQQPQPGPTGTENVPGRLPCPAACPVLYRLQQTKTKEQSRGSRPNFVHPQR